jgi:hypothetical protein
MSLGLIESHERPPAPPADEAQPKAVRFFSASSMDEAQGAARAFLAGARYCPRCSRAHGRLPNRLGPTLFLDDDPLALIWAFDPEDRSACAAHVIAACIVLFGRPRRAAR